MSYCTCVRDMKQPNTKYIFKNTDTHRVPGHQLWAKIKLKVPHRVQSTFLYTISGVQFLLELKHGEGRRGEAQGQLLIASEKHYFHVSVSKDECLRGKEKIRGRKENIKREKSIIQECKTVMHHSQIQ